MVKTITVTKARSEIYKLLNAVNNGSTPITITNKNGDNGVLVSEEEWRSIQETMYLHSIPGLAESIKDGLNEPKEEWTMFNKDEEW